MKTQVVHGGELRSRWEGLYATLEDYLSIQHLLDDDYDNATFDLFDNGFVLNLDKHDVVEID